MEFKTLNKVLIIGILIITTAFTIALLALLIQTFNIDSGMTASIIGGVLSMFGGMVGAMSAYLIAEMQMTKQLDLQYKKEREKMLLEIKINKYQELIIIYENLLHSLYITKITFIENIYELCITDLPFERKKERSLNIVNQIKDLRMNLTKINAYKGFFEDDEIVEMPHIISVVQASEVEIYRLINEAREVRYTTKAEYEQITDDMINKINVIIDKPELQVFNTLEFIQNRLSNLIKNNN